jgi:hypothetical protein
MKPLIRSTWVAEPSEGLIADVMNAYPMYSRQGAIDLLTREGAKGSYWINDVYQVYMTQEGDYTHLNIRRRDGEVIYRDWRDFQDIKNQLVGEDSEAVELYPAEDRVVDTSNKYHLYCAPPGFRFPFGFVNRDVVNEPGSANGTRQRPRG